MKTNRVLRIVVSIVVVVAAVWYFQSREEASDPPTTASSVENATSAEPGVQQPGMIAHIDPVTGKPLESPPPEVLPPAEANTSTVGLVEEPSPGGGMMVDLQGRFQNSAVATAVDSDSVKIECVPEAHDHEDSPESGSDGGS